MEFHGEISHLSQASAFEDLLNESVRRRWVVYAKKPFGGPQQVLKYLARYTHRVAISNSRIVAIDKDTVTFRWKNYAAASRPEMMTLDAVEFLRRFLLHSLPKGFQRIRQFGFLSNRHRSAAIPVARKLIDKHSPSASAELSAEDIAAGPGTDSQHSDRCPKCDSRRVRRFDVVLIEAAIRQPHFLNCAAVPEYDTS